MSKAQLKLRGISYRDEGIVNSRENTIEINGQIHRSHDLVLDAPVSGTVYGTLLNYKGARDQLGDAVNEAPYKNAPVAPILYIKPANTMIGYGMNIPLPVDVSALEMGAALGIVIGRAATNVSTETALEHVEGFTIVNDVSIPHESVYRPAISQKARDGFCPIGPWVVSREEIKDPDHLGVRVYINDVLSQENSTENLIRSVAQLIADVTEFMTLQKGDILLAGVPENAPLAKAGDRVRIEIDHIGFLENTIVSEKAGLEGKE